MEVRPGYKQTEVGIIPEDWGVVSALEACSKIQDGTHFSPRSGGNDYLYVTSKNVRFGYLDLSTAGWIDAAQHQAIYRRCDVKKGDLLLTKDGANTGNAALNNLAEEFSLLSSVAFLRFNLSKHCAAYFLQQVLTSQGQRQIQDAMAGNAITRLTLDKINKLRFSIPPTKTEQEAIAEALSDADALIKSLEQLLAKKCQLKQGAMQELLTGKKRLPGFESKPGYKQTEVGVIPEDWKPAALSALSSMKSGKGITSANINQFSKYPCYGGNGLRGFTTRFTHDGCYALVGRQGALCGNVVGVEGKFFASEHAIVVTASPRTDIRWLTFVLRKMHLNQYSESSAQPGLSVSKILSLNIACPPSKAEQTAIAKVLSDMDAELAALEQRRDKTRSLKQGMMQELLTGRTRLV